MTGEINIQFDGKRFGGGGTVNAHVHPEDDSIAIIAVKSAHNSLIDGKVVPLHMDRDELDELIAALQIISEDMDEPGGNAELGPRTPSLPLDDRYDLHGKNVLVTGTVPMATREQIAGALRPYKANVVSTPARSTDVVFVGHTTQSRTKIDKADRLGIPVLTWLDLLYALDLVDEIGVYWDGADMVDIVATQAAKTGDRTFP